MNFQKPVKNIWNNKSNKLSQLNQLIYRSNLLGSDLSITNFGGGNTSSKINPACLLGKSRIFLPDPDTSFRASTEVFIYLIVKLQQYQQVSFSDMN